jgi:hypothetical protein
LQFLYYNKEIAKELKEYLSSVKKHYAEIYNRVSKSKDEWLAQFQNSDASKNEFQNMKMDYQNEKLEELVKNDDPMVEALIIEKSKLIPTKDPIFRDGSGNSFIRSHFFAPRKNIFGNYYSTFWVNIIVIWMMSLFLWITLYYDALRKALKFFEDIPKLFGKK